MGLYILVSEFALQSIKNSEKYTYRILDQSKSKGKSNTIAVYEIFNRMSDYLELHLQTKIDFEKRTPSLLVKWIYRRIESFQRVMEISPPT